MGQNTERAGETIHHDRDGNEFVLDENGNRRKPMTAPESARRTASGFTYYEAEGYCGLCGRTDCRGSCFK